MTPRRRVSIVFALLVAVLATCSSIDNVDIEVGGRAVIPQRSIIDELIGQLSFVGFEGFDIAESQEFQNQGYTKDQVDAVRLKRFRLTIASPQGATFDFLEAIRFYAEADGLPRVLIAELDPIADGLTVLDLAVDADVDLQPYVVAPSMTITTAASGIRPEQETTVDAQLVLEVDVNVTGSCS